MPSSIFQLGLPLRQKHRPTSPLRSMVGRNVIANLTGQVFTVVVGLICVPWYLRLLGPAAYGLVGFFVTAVAILGMLDFGITPSVNRQVARFRAASADARTVRDFIRTLECVYLAIGVAIGIALFFLLPKFGESWALSGQMSKDSLFTALRLMAVLAAVQWPISFYQGILFGLERHASVNLVIVVSTLLRSAGALAVLALIAPTATVFFSWQLVAASLQVATLAWIAWASIPSATSRPRFQLSSLLEIRGFAIGLGLTSILTLLLRQADKIVLSRIVSLTLFGYYTIATLVGTGLAMISGPIFIAAFPRLTALVERGDRPGLIRLYHHGCQLVAVATAPLTVALALYMPLALWAWTGDPRVVAASAIPATILILGTFINGLVGIPYDIQLAHGFTRLGVFKNAIGVVILVPATFLLAKRYGLPGAAVAWLLLNLGYLVIEMPLVHRWYLKGEGRTWLFQDALLPTAAALAGACVLWPWRLAPTSRFSTAIFVMGAWVLATVASGASSGFVRERARGLLFRGSERSPATALKP